jgi:hypothetical protein
MLSLCTTGPAIGPQGRGHVHAVDCGLGARQEGGQTIFEAGDKVLINPAAFTQLGLEDTPENRGVWTVEIDPDRGFLIAQTNVDTSGRVSVTSTSRLPIDPALLTLVTENGKISTTTKVLLIGSAALAVGALVYFLRR